MFSLNAKRHEERSSGLISLILVVLSGLVTASCSPASTQYQPLKEDRAYLVMKRGGLAYFKNGSTVSARSAVSPALLGCAPGAQAVAADARSDMQTAQVLGLVGNMTLWTGVGVVLVGVSARLQAQAASEFIDAINIHNDEESCQKEQIHAQAK